MPLGRSRWHVLDILRPPNSDGLRRGRRRCLAGPTHGWQVTAVDISVTALERTSAHGSAAGVSDRLTTGQHDLARTFPTGTFDLISAQYLHTLLEFPRTRILRRAAHALTAGGLLLNVDHGSVRPCDGTPTARPA
ncbi:SAM-dependent methyltransferase [Streptomyces sp. LBL]|uniref:SAM-dependent methyltransferase n=1 Tax=Streptomyces sp. LBL TaxID=2940562 RepID=UPI0024741E85|nr:class I SAM-dependent methyltransferase [Streptomyces sp. LBL]MDH6626100.1 SAM-dependent methyltransferase [Streptomyces sp. LBL]